LPAITITRLTDCPVAADQIGLEELGGLIYVVAGRTADAHSQKVYAYDPTTNTWTEKADYPIAVQSLCLRAVSGKLYGIGGHNSTTATFYKDVYEYDPAANTWTKKTDMPTGREDFGSAVFDGKIYCFGGLTDTPEDYTLTKVMEVYDPATDTWDETLADLPDYKHFGDFGATHNGLIYAVDGSNTFASYPFIFNVSVMYIYNPATDTWATDTGCEYPRSYKRVVALTDKIVLVSGNTMTTTDYTKTIYSYTPSTDTWTREGDAPYSAGGTGLAVLDGAIYLCGGQNPTKLAYFYKLEL
jgi:N-acetylneuraminic acid mutarotase